VDTSTCYEVCGWPSLLELAWDKIELHNQWN